MISGGWLLISSLICCLQLQTGSFPKPLSQQEEQRYLELAQKGDLEARNTLIERNMRLVAHIMKKYYAQVSEQEDLISIGTIGLIKGVSTFDASKGTRLATYAARCVENAILSPTPLYRSKKERKANQRLSFPFCLMFSMMASNRDSFCLFGQGRALICRITDAAWIWEICFASCDASSSVVGE